MLTKIRRDIADAQPAVESAVVAMRLNELSQRLCVALEVEPVHTDGRSSCQAVDQWALLGHHTQRVRVDGTLILVKISTAANSKSIGVATLLVPQRALPFLQLGEHVILRCPACAQQSLWPQPAIVKQIDPHPITFPEPAIQSTAVKPEPLHQLALLLERPLSESSEELIVEAEVPVARESLLKWLFARPQAQQEMAK